MNKPASQPLELTIYSLPFRLRAPEEEHPRLERAARHVDTTMRELVASNPSADTTRLAIQAAFLIATDYFRTLDESFAGGTSPSELGRRVEEMLSGLDKAFADLGLVLPVPQTAGSETREPTPDAPANEDAGAEPASASAEETPPKETH